MSYTYNQIILMGRLTKDPEYKKFENGKEKTNFTLAVNRPYKNKDTQINEADFIQVALWGKTAKTAKRILKKGSPILTWGRLQINQYLKEENKKGWHTEVISENYQLHESLSQYEDRIKKGILT